MHNLLDEYSTSPMSPEMTQSIENIVRINTEFMSKLDLSFVQDFSNLINQMDLSFINDISHIYHEMNIPQIVELSKSLTSLPIDIEIAPDVTDYTANIPENIVIIYKNEEKKLPNKIAVFLLSTLISGFISGCFQTPTAQNSLDNLIKSVIERYEDTKDNVSIKYVDPNQ